MKKLIVKKVGKKLKALTEMQKVNQIEKGLKPGIEKYINSKGKKMPAGKVKAKVKNLQKDLKTGSGKSNQQMERSDMLINEIKKANPRVAKSIDAKATKSFNKSKPKKKAKIKGTGAAKRGFGKALR